MKGRRLVERRRIKATDVLSAPEQAVEDALFDIDVLVTKEKVDALLEDIIREPRSKKLLNRDFSSESLELGYLRSYEILISLKPAFGPNQEERKALERFRKKAIKDISSELEDYEDDPDSDDRPFIMAGLGALARLAPGERDTLPAFPETIDESFEILKLYHGGTRLDDLDGATSLAYNLYSIDPERFKSIGIPERVYDLLMDQPLDAADQFESDVLFEIAMIVRLMAPERPVMSPELREVFHYDLRPRNMADVAAHCVAAADHIEYDEDGNLIIRFKKDDLHEVPPLPERPQI